MIESYPVVAALPFSGIECEEIRPVFFSYQYLGLLACLIDSLFIFDI